MARQPPSQHQGPFIDLEHEPFDAAEVSRIIERVGFPLVAPFDDERLRTNLCQVAQYHQLLTRMASAPTAALDRDYLAGLNRAAQRLCRLLPLDNLPAGGSPDDFQAEPAFGVWNLLQAPLQEEMDDQLARERLASLRASEARANLARAADETVRPATPREDLSITLEELFGSAYGKDVLILATRINGLIAAATERALSGIEAAKSPAPATNERIAVKLMKLYSKAFGREVGFSRPGAGEDRTVGGPMVRFVRECCQKMGIHLEPGSIAKYKQDNFPTNSV